MPQYFLSIVENESAYQAEGAASFDEVMHAHRSFAEAVSAAGAKIISSEALQPIATATYLRGHRIEGGKRRRQSVARSQGSRRRLLPRRCSRRRDGVAIGQIVPGCIRLHRTASDLGHS